VTPASATVVCESEAYAKEAAIKQRANELMLHHFRGKVIHVTFFLHCLYPPFSMPPPFQLRLWRACSRRSSPTPTIMGWCGSNHRRPPSWGGADPRGILHRGDQGPDAGSPEPQAPILVPVRLSEYAGYASAAHPPSQKTPSGASGREERLKAAVGFRRGVLMTGSAGWTQLRTGSDWGVLT
jgi:hypothetical protein